MTDDLDLFSPPVESMELAVQRLRRAASAIGATVEGVQEAPEFRRFAVKRAADVTLVDLVIDRAPQLVADRLHMRYARDIVTESGNLRRLFVWTPARG